MAPTYLVDEDIEAGKELLKALDKKRVPVQSFFWYADPEAGERWRLFIASRVVDRQGATEMVRRIEDVLPLITTAHLRMDAIVTASPNSAVVDEIREDVLTSSTSVDPVSLPPKAVVYRST